jgi:LmbE family N-acetylglucosaminyl deacetylase
VDAVSADAGQHRTVVLPVNDLPPGDEVSHDLAVPLRALAVGAHPDDIEFGCGATLAKWSAAGCAVFHLVLTDGAKGTWAPGADRDMLVAGRQAEARAAAAALGSTEVFFLGRTDGELENTAAERWEVSRVIRTLRPAVVLGHDPWRRYRLHPDHRHAGFIVTDALIAARDPLFFPDQGLDPHRPESLLLWEADQPNHVESVTGFETTKVAGLLAHESQFETTLGIPAGTTTAAADDEAVAGFRLRVVAQLQAHGRLGGVALGESFRLVAV